MNVYLPKPIDDKHDEEWEVKRGTELEDFLGNGVEGDDSVEGERGQWRRMMRSYAK